MENRPLNTARSIKFQNGKLKIMHITDTHMEDENIDYSLVLIARACDIEKPHIAIVTGDNVLNYDDAEKTKSYISRFMKIFSDRNIPVAITDDIQQRKISTISAYRHKLSYIPVVAYTIAKQLTNRKQLETSRLK